MIKVTSPGKLILSGEHAVVYGATACATAINKTIEATYQLRHDAMIVLYCAELSMNEKISLDRLFKIYENVTDRYKNFTDNKSSIHAVIEHPIELCWATIASVLVEKHFTQGVTINLMSNIPFGCGMGSSASLIVNLLFGLNQLFQLDLSEEKISRLALQAENWQHGYSSGLDLQLSLKGGIHVFRKSHALIPVEVTALPLQYFNSGKPMSTTGECVSFVKEQNFPASMWKEFEETTLGFIDALKNNDQKILINMVKKNHRLLCDIGVVPTNIQKIIADIEAQGGAAKICGAGSIRGEKAGIILMTDNIHFPHAVPFTCFHQGTFLRNL